jgi:hypothetical protein
MGEKSLRKGTQKALLMQAIERQKKEEIPYGCCFAVKTAGGAFLYGDGHYFMQARGSGKWSYSALLPWMTG